MKVRELIQKLSGLDQDLEVICWTEDEEFASDKRPFRLFDINSVEVTHGESTRVDGAPYMKIGKSDRSIPHAVLDITSDF